VEHSGGFGLFRSGAASGATPGPQGGCPLSPLGAIAGFGASTGFFDFPCLFLRGGLGGCRRRSGAEKGQEFGLMPPNRPNLSLGEPAGRNHADAVVAGIQAEALSSQLGQQLGGGHITTRSCELRGGTATCC